jgi:hypothetical protein
MAYSDIDLSEFDDDDIRDEYEARRLGGVAQTWDEHTELEKAHRLHHEGKKEQAYEILWQMCLIKLNKIV